MDVQESQSNWPEMRKTLGKPGFCSGEDRNRTTYKFPGKLALRHHARREIRRAPISMICDDSEHYPSRPTCNFFAARFTRSRIQDRSQFTGSRFRFTGSQVWGSDCDSFSVSIRHYLAACWMDSGPRGSCRSRSGMTACPSSVAPTDKARQR